MTACNHPDMPTQPLAWTPCFICEFRRGWGREQQRHLTDMRELWWAEGFGMEGTVIEMEMRVLVRGGATMDDFFHGMVAMGRARDVWDPWSYVRAVMLRRAAQRHQDAVMEDHL
jgi:hypothetical protein